MYLLERHLVLERRVAPLQLEMLLDHLREHRRRVDGHEILLLWFRHRLSARSCRRPGLRPGELVNRPSVAIDSVGDDDPVLALALGRVERRVGRREDLAELAALREGGDAEAGGHRDQIAVRHLDAAAPRSLPGALGEPCAAGGVGAGQHERELLAAPAAGDVALAHRLAQRGGERLQHLVAGRVPVAVVHLLEVVEVGEHHGRPCRRSARARELGARATLRGCGGSRARSGCRPSPAARPCGGAVRSRARRRPGWRARRPSRPGRPRTSLGGSTSIPKSRGADAEREGQPLRARVRVAGAGQLPVRAEDDAARGAGRLDRGLDDDPDELGRDRAWRRGPRRSARSPRGRGVRSRSSSASRSSSWPAMRLNASPSSANSSLPRTSTRSPRRPEAIALAASARRRSVRTTERPSR